MTLYFIALLPPQEIQDYVNDIKEYFAIKYQSRHAQKSPPHITLQPPFAWEDANLPELEKYLQDFAQEQKSLTITLSNYAAFVPRVIYVNVNKTPELLILQANLTNYLQDNLVIINTGKTRAFVPHITVAFKDLTRQNFWAAWTEFEQRQLDFEFLADKLTLLLYDGSWKIKSSFTLLNHL